MTFKFRLEQVLDIRKDEQKARESELAEILREKSAEEEHLAAILAESDQRLVELRHAQSAESVSINMLCLGLEYLGQLATRADQRRGEIERIELSARERRERLAEAMRKKRILELLRDKQKARHTAEALRVELNTSDELSNSRYVRSTQSATRAGSDGLARKVEKP